MGSKSRKKASPREGERLQTPLEIQFDRLIQSVDEDESLGDRSGLKRGVKEDTQQPEEQQQPPPMPVTPTTSDTNLFSLASTGQNTFSFTGLAKPNGTDQQPQQEPTHVSASSNGSAAEELVSVDEAPKRDKEDENVDRWEQQAYPGQVITLRRELEEGVEQEEQIVFQFPDGESNNNNNDDDDDDDENADDDDETRDRLVQFVGLPAHPPELTSGTTRGWTSDNYPSALSPAYPNDTAEGGGSDGNEAPYFSEHEAHQFIEFNFGVRGEQQIIGDMTMHFFEEEEEEESDDDSSAERPPIPGEVISNVDDDESDYDTELEFDASDDSSVEPSKEKEPDERMYKEGLDEEAGSASYVEVEVNDDDDDENDVVNLHANDPHEHGVEAGVRIAENGASAADDAQAKPLASKEQPIPPQPHTEERSNSEPKNERRRWWMMLFAFLCCIAVVAAIAVPLLLREDDDGVRSVDPDSLVQELPPPSPNPSTLRPQAVVVPSMRPTDPPVADQPENDKCDAAIGPLQPNGAVTRGSIASAGIDIVDRCGSVNTNGPGVWYYAMGTGGEMMAHTCQNTYFDTKITIFEGDCDKPICIEGNDDLCGPTTSFSAVSWQSRFQQVYLILVHGNSDDSGNGNFELALVSRYNDECSTALGPLPVSLDGFGSPLQGDTLSANPNDIPCNGEMSNSPSVFYLVRGTGGTLTASICDSLDFRANIAIMTGSCTSGLTCLDKTQGESCTISWESVAFQDYYVMIDGETADDFGSFELLVTTSDVPDNDSCDQALGPLPLDASTVTGITTGASVDSDTPFCASAVSSPGVWYSVIGNGFTLQASLCEGASYDTRLSIFEGSCPSGSVEGLQCVDGNDDFCGTQSLVAWLSEEGREYYILVHGYQQGAGDFKLSVSSISDA